MDDVREYRVGQQSYVVIGDLGPGRLVATREGGSGARFLITEARPTTLSDHELEERLEWNKYVDHLAKLDAVESGDSRTVIVEQINRGVPATNLPLPLDLEQALSIVSGLVSVLHSLHFKGERGTLLGRIQPALIYVDLDSAVLTLASLAPRVFALASLEQPPGTLDDDIARFGRLPFLSPEALAGKKPGKAGDVFLLGCLLHWLTTGEEPLDGLYPPDPERLRVALRGGRRQPFNGPSTLEPLLRKALATLPDYRPTLKEFQTLLDGLRTTAGEARIANPCDWVSPHATESSARMALDLDDVGLTLEDRLEFALNARRLTQRQLLELGLGWAVDAVKTAGAWYSRAPSRAKRLLRDARFLIERAVPPNPGRLPALLRTSRELYLASVRDDVPVDEDPIRLAHHVVEGVVHWTCLSWGLPPLCDVPGAPTNTDCLYSDSELHWAQLRGQKGGAGGWAAKVGTVRTYEDHTTVATGQVLYRSLIGWLSAVAAQCVALVADDKQCTDGGRWASMLRDLETAIGSRNHRLDDTA
jgi:hypothetical protein